jgi:alcohol dehydrogenase YqhD (iron-dependent ADH family)
MDNFIYNAPTKVFFGKGRENELGEILKSYNIKKIMLHYGHSSIKKSGLYDKITKILNDNKIEFIDFGGADANPKLSKVLEGIKIIKNNPVDLILAVGGGSVIDSAKSMAVGAKVDFSPWKFSIKEETAKDHIPVGVILTLSASGSDMSNSCVITNDQTLEKRGFSSEENRPLFAILNPELTFSVNKFQTGCGIVDIMMHTLERYFNGSSDNEPADGFAEALLRSVIKAAKVVVKDPTDYDARAVLMLMSSLSHNDLTSIGKGKMLFVHQIEHAVSGVYPSVAHAAGLAVLFPAWCKFYVNYDTDKFNQLATNVFDLRKANKLENAKAGIQEFEKLFASLGMPKSFKDLGIDNPDIELLADLVTDNGKKVISHPKKDMDKEVVKTIIKSCL